MDYKQVKQAEEEAARVKVQEDLKKEACVLVQEVSFILDVVLRKGFAKPFQNLKCFALVLFFFPVGGHAKAPGGAVCS